MRVRDILLQVSSWRSFVEQLRPLKEKEKGDCFEALCRYYLRLEPKYSTALTDVWSLKEVPHEVRNRLGLPLPDEGIDLLCRARDGEFWAVQCKYQQDETRSLTRRELSTFTDLAFCLCKNIALGLVCTTADRFSHRLKQYGNRLAFCAGDVWRALDEEFFERLHRFLQGVHRPPKAALPRPHQERAVQSAFEYFCEGREARGKLIMPCATGKTLTALWISERLNAKRILVAVPSLALIRQMLEAWSRECAANDREVNWICVCSDESLEEIEVSDSGMLSHDLGVHVHTKADDITAWLNARRDSTLVVFTTYQSGRVVARASKAAGIVFDLGIMDEAHKTVGKKGALFSYLLEDANISVRHRLFMTATERFYVGHGEHVASMDDQSLYGDYFEVLTYKEALAYCPPIVADYCVVCIGVTKPEVAKLVQENAWLRPDRGSWDTDVEAEMLAAAVALRKAMQEYPISHAVSFHSSVRRAKRFKDIQSNFNSACSQFGFLDTFHVCGTMPTAVRSGEIERFKSSAKGLITNARCLAEGVDVPDIDCVLFADPKGSKIDIVQSMGRVLRPASGKSYGYVVVPILLEDSDMRGDYAKSVPFKHMLAVLRALAANDDRIIEYFRNACVGRRTASGMGPVEIDIPVGMVIDTEAFVDAIHLKLWQRVARLAWRPFEEARTFVRGLGLKSVADWRAYCLGRCTDGVGRPCDIPSSPDMVYRESGWVSFGDWLGTETIAPQLRQFLPFPEARSFVHQLALRNQMEWGKYCKGEMTEKPARPQNIPSGPANVYKGSGWTDLGDWLGTGSVALQLRTFLPFEDARSYARGLGLKNADEWKKHRRGEMPGLDPRPLDVPSHPDEEYKDKGWRGWGDFLGTGREKSGSQKFMPFHAAREYVGKLGLRSRNEWLRYCRGEIPEKGRRPGDIPYNPGSKYADQGWVSWGDWLGTGQVASQSIRYRVFEEARAFARSLGYRSVKEWVKWTRSGAGGKPSKPDDIPAYPDQTYHGKGWVNWGDWLGNKECRTRKRRPGGR